MNKLLVLGVLFLTSLSYGASDRFGGMRAEISRASYTTTADVNVFIATVSVVPADCATCNGSLVLRGILFSGVNPSTITFYDDSQFNGNSSTMVSLSYQPQIGVGVGVGAPVYVPLDMFVSSGIGYHVIGATPKLIKWDWLSPRKTGDNRK